MTTRSVWRRSRHLRRRRWCRRRPMRPSSRRCQSPRWGGRGGGVAGSNGGSGNDSAPAMAPINDATDEAIKANDGNGEEEEEEEEGEEVSRRNTWAWRACAASSSRIRRRSDCGRSRPTFVRRPRRKWRRWASRHRWCGRGSSSKSTASGQRRAGGDVEE